MITLPPLAYADAAADIGLAAFRAAGAAMPAIATMLDAIAVDITLRCIRYVATAMPPLLSVDGYAMSPPRC